MRPDFYNYSPQTDFNLRFVRHIIFCTLLAVFLANARSAMAEPFFPLLTKHAADSIRISLSKNIADTNQVNRFVQLGQFYVYKPGSVKADLDSAFLFYKQAFALSKRLVFSRGEIKSMYVLGAIQSENFGKQQAEKTHRKAIEMCRKMGYLVLEAEGWYYVGEIFMRTDQSVPNKIKYYEKSMQLYSKAGMIEKQAYVQKRIADMNFSAGNLELALRQLLEALRLYKSIKFLGLHHTYGLLVSVTRSMGNYQDALTYGLAVLESSRAAGDTASLTYPYLQLGWICEQLNQPEDAIKYHKLAFEKAKGQRDSGSLFYVVKFICHNLLILNRPAEANSFFQGVFRKFPPRDNSDSVEIAYILTKYYLFKKDYLRAEKYIPQIVAYEDNLAGVTGYKIEAYRNVGDFYLEAGKYEKARYYLEQAWEWNKTHGTAFLNDNMLLHRSMFKLDSARGNYTSAIAHYQQYKTLNDSIFNATKSKQIASIQIQYDTKKKEQDNALLRRRNQAQQASIREKDFQRNAAFAGAVMLMLLLGLSYNQYRIKKRSNAQLQIKQKEITLKSIRQQHLLEEKEWLLKEIHHRVKNNLQTVMSLLESQSAYLKNDALAAIRDSQHRVHAMSLIHQKLYLSDNVTTIDTQIYIQELVSYLRDSFDTRQKIRFELELEPIDLDIAQAIPLGLILNEAITNSIKYAFPEHSPGLISVSFHQPSEGQFRLKIEDNGVGLPAGFDDLKHTSLGIRLMHGLSNEIGGKLNMNSGPGTLISILFNVDRVFRQTDMVGQQASYQSHTETEMHQQ